MLDLYVDTFYCNLIVIASNSYDLAFFSLLFARYQSYEVDLTIRQFWMGETACKISQHKYELL